MNVKYRTQTANKIVLDVQGVAKIHSTYTPKEYILHNGKTFAR